VILVELLCREDGSFLSCKAKGHAGYSSAGTDIVCSAVTILLRTSCQVLSGVSGINLETKIKSRGTLFFRADKKETFLDSEEVSTTLKCVADYIKKGIETLSLEYPKYVSLMVKKA
jgi:uncharacterized protein YsxB (DUF464 family)